VPERGRDKSSLAADVWRELFDFIIATADHRSRVLERLRLTPNDSRALGSLDPERGRTMRSLAEAWGCDASTATWIVDRLEKRGLVERRSAPTDRRVTLVALTARGVKTKARMVRGVYEPPPQLEQLTNDDLIALRDAAAKLRKAT
jgi:MarR family transcriptional regulator, organic hydroperoxide resistance regulator